ncbi:UBA/THIF-type NAD/FAD binding protein [Corchorus olitorius]|uniref:UBA/THIF-type NAD/FAD binding protein n=1 Tax=Corchorus olitorius TaxID=93759 RepID=A0A1R3GVB8_9ROSI|nr:UBA/THIF-type NAD/FAD binding protein [Corchorus olitorius]
MGLIAEPYFVIKAFSKELRSYLEFKRREDRAAGIEEPPVELSLHVLIGFRPGGFQLNREVIANKHSLHLFEYISQRAILLVANFTSLLYYLLPRKRADEGEVVGGVVKLWDLSSNFVFSESDIGKTRAFASVQKLQEVNIAVIISTLTTKLTKEQLSDFQMKQPKVLNFKPLREAIIVGSPYMIPYNTAIASLRGLCYDFDDDQFGNILWCLEIVVEPSKGGIAKINCVDGLNLVTCWLGIEQVSPTYDVIGLIIKELFVCLEYFMAVNIEENDIRTIARKSFLGVQLQMKQLDSIKMLAKMLSWIGTSSWFFIHIAQNSNMLLVVAALMNFERFENNWIGDPSTLVAYGFEVLNFSRRKPFSATQQQDYGFFEAWERILQPCLFLASLIKQIIGLAANFQQLLYFTSYHFALIFHMVHTWVLAPSLRQGCFHGMGIITGQK